MPRKLNHGHGRRELLVNRRRFAVLNLLLVAILVVAAYWVYQTAFAANVVVSGRLVYNGVGVYSSGLKLVECGSNPAPKVVTDKGGYFKCTVGDKADYHIGIDSGLVSGASGGPTIKREEVSNAKSYEWQVANDNCYHKTRCFKYENGVWKYTTAWDLWKDTGLNFKYNKSFNVPVSGKVTLNGAGRGGVTLNCNGQNVTTNSSGNFSCNSNANGDYYSVKVISGLPSNATGGATNNRSEHASSKSYENQYPAISCYKNIACDGLKDELQTWDRGTTRTSGGGYADTGFDFAYTTPAAPKPQCSDGKDNDGDGLIDYGRDPGCATTVDNSESPNPVNSKPPVRPPVITNPVPGSGGGTPAVSDTTKPSVPGDFRASLGSDPSNVILSWKSSTDASGIKNYQLDRSKDRVKWSTLSGKITGSSYTDTHTDFKTAYFYRIRATDNAGNRSSFVQTDIVTGEFTPTPSGSTVTSEDGFVQALLPDGSLDKDVSCSITTSDENSGSLRGAKLELIHGPYAFACKDKEGTFVDSFKSPIEFTMTPDPEKVKKFQNLTIMQYTEDTQVWEPAEVSTEGGEEQVILKFTSDQPLEFALMGEPKPGLPWGIISFIVFILLAIAGAFIFLLRRAQAQHYQDYLRRKYYNL